MCLLLFVLPACDSGGGTDTERFPDKDCIISTDPFFDGGVGRGEIPSLSVDVGTEGRPRFVSPDGEGTEYLSDSTRVIGLTVDGQPYAVPHNILWWHEIINVNVADRRIAITYCPLTGSSLAFDRSVVDGAEFGVSGLLFRNNLTMFDQTEQESLWPQMNRAAGCGPRAGTTVEMISVIEMTWTGWSALHPDTRVVSSRTGYARDYTTYPYGDYKRPNSRRLFDSRTAIDDRRPPKERVLGIPAGDGGVAFPFGAFNDGSPKRVVETTVGGESIVVLWSHTRRSAMAYRPMVDGTPVTFEVRDGRIVDTDTGSEWTVDGRAVSGARQGARLEPVQRTYVAFWFAWATFQPETELWNG